MTTLQQTYQSTLESMSNEQLQAELDQALIYVNVNDVDVDDLLYIDELIAEQQYRELEAEYADEGLL